MHRANWTQQVKKQINNSFEKHTGKTNIVANDNMVTLKKVSKKEAAVSETQIYTLGNWSIWAQKWPGKYKINKNLGLLRDSEYELDITFLEVTNKSVGNFEQSTTCSSLLVKAEICWGEIRVINVPKIKKED